MVFLETWWISSQHRYCLIYIMTKIEEGWLGSCSIKKPQSLAQFPYVSQFPDSEPICSRRSQIPIRTDPERPEPMTITWVIMNWRKNNTQLFQGLLDMGSQLTFIFRYPKCYYTLIIMCVLGNGVAHVQLLMGLLAPQTHLVDTDLKEPGSCESYSSRGPHPELFFF